VEYLHHLDLAALSASAGRLNQPLVDATSGVTGCAVNCVTTPAGDGSPAGLHTHVVDQIFYVLQGTMSLEIAGAEYQAGPGTLITFPAGVAHRNWNRGTEPTVHLAINAPQPDPREPFARPAE
jgi:mannose-6-phosphate isomerase-like protein (cupin superfamily)